MGAISHKAARLSAVWTRMAVESLRRGQGRGRAWVRHGRNDVAGREHAVKALSQNDSAAKNPDREQTQTHRQGAKGCSRGCGRDRLAHVGLNEREHERILLLRGRPQLGCTSYFRGKWHLQARERLPREEIREPERPFEASRANAVLSIIEYPRSQTWPYKTQVSRVHGQEPLCQN